MRICTSLDLDLRSGFLRNRVVTKESERERWEMFFWKFASSAW